jgi:hypothetical protein
MRAPILLFAVLLLLIPCAGRAQEAKKPEPEAAKADLKAVFREPVALVDQDGEPIVTRRAVGHPAVCDFNGDGRPDVALGCHVGMNTVRAEILLLENVGTKAAPRFRWPARRKVQIQPADAAPAAFCTSAGCKSGGTFIVHPLDANGDGHVDLVVNTMWGQGVRLLLNTGASRTDPTFRDARKLFSVGGHGKNSGGGDWNGDGIEDLVFPANHYGWQVYLGRRTPDGGVRFSDKPDLASRDYAISGRQRWWHYTPYAWSFCGRRAAGAKVTEVIASNPDPQTADAPYAKKRCSIDLYRLDHGSKTAALLGRVAVSHAAATRLAIGDLNADGRMDCLYTGGVFTKGQDTKIHVLYGKQPNIPAAPARAAAD